MRLIYYDAMPLVAAPHVTIGSGYSLVHCLTISCFVAGTPTPDDELKIRITDTSDGAGLYTVRSYFNNVLKHSETDFPINFQPMFYYGPRSEFSIEFTFGNYGE